MGVFMFILELLSGLRGRGWNGLQSRASRLFVL